MDVKTNYKRITEEFCRYYINMYDNNFQNLANMYKTDSLFTYTDDEIIGFNNLVEKIRQYNIYKFTHSTVNVNSQPVGDRTLLVTLTGKISVNNSVIEQKFSETLLLQRDDHNRFYIYHTIFKLIE
jgi:hypothetical protein